MTVAAIGMVAAAVAACASSSSSSSSSLSLSCPCAAVMMPTLLPSPTPPSRWRCDGLLFHCCRLCLRCHRRRTILGNVVVPTSTTGGGCDAEEDVIVPRGGHSHTPPHTKIASLNDDDRNNDDYDKFLSDVVVVLARCTRAEDFSLSSDVTMDRPVGLVYYFHHTPPSSK
jgi:hypothetical protein